MSGSNLPTTLPPTEVLSPREAQDLGARLDAAISTGAVRETPRVDGISSRLQTAAAPLPSQAQRDAAWQAAPAAAPTDASSRQAQQQQVAAVSRTAKL